MLLLQTRCLEQAARELPMNRRMFSKYLASISASVIMVSALGAAASAQEGLTKDSLVIVTPSADVTWAFDNALGVMEPLMNVHATLLRKPYTESKTGNALQQDLYTYEPYLVADYSASEDGLVYTFNLRTDVVSVAGNKLTADDVIWSFERKFNTPTSVTPGAFAGALTDPAKQIAKVDEDTFSVTVKDRAAGTLLLALISDIGAQIYDSTLLKQHVTAEDPYAVKWSAANPNYGFGPYTVESFQQGVEVVLAAREDFFLGAPSIKRVVFKAVSDPGSRANAVRDGYADIAEGLRPSDIGDLKSNAAVKVPVVDNPNTMLMLPLVVNKPPFDNVKVREAFAYAVPYQQIIDNVYRGAAVRTSPGLLDSQTPNFSNEGYPDYIYDPAKAKALLAEAGLAEGVGLTLSINSANADAQQAGLMIQSAAADAGFNVELQQLPDGAFTQQKAAHDFQAYLTIDYAVTMLPSYALRAFTQAGNSNNLADWTDASFEELLAKGFAAGDPLGAEAGKYWNEAEKLMLDQSPIIKIVNMQPTVALAANVDGYAWRSDNWIDYRSIEKQ